MSNWTRTTFSIKQSLLRKAFDENRGPQMIARILHHVHRARLTSEEKAAIILIPYYYGDARSINALNLIEKMEGSGRRYRTNNNEEDGVGPVFS